MINLPKVFIGTLYSGEGDYDACKQAIESQFGVTVTHHVVMNKPEKEAHNLLWSAWREVQGTDYDMFVKIDADTVLSHQFVLSELWKLMSSDKRITSIQAPLHDYYTDNFINGLNCFSPRVQFKDTTNDLYCDRNVDFGHEISLHAGDVPKSLAPAGKHCHYATEIQSFHYGLHRMLKGQIDIIMKTRTAWNMYQDRNRAFALLGAKCSSSNRTKFNYSDEEFKNMFLSVQSHYDELVHQL